MTQEEMKAILEEFKSGLPVGITKEQMESTITAKMAELTAKFEATASKEELKKLEETLKEHARLISEGKANAKEEKTLGIYDAIMKMFDDMGIKSAADFKKHPEFKSGVEFKAEVPTLTTAQTGTIGRTDMMTSPVFAATRKLAFLPYMRKMPLSDGKSVIGWTTGSYTSNVGYVGENAKIGTNDAATATEKTRGLAKVQAIKIITEQLKSDLPELARQMESKFMEEFMLFIDAQIYSGDGNPDTDANPTHFYGLKNHATAFDATEFAATVEKANLADLVDAIKTKAKKQFKTINKIWINPTDAYKYRRTKDTEGQYVIGTLITGESVVSGVVIEETEAVTAGTLLAADTSVLQLRVKKEVTLRVGEFGDDAKYERESALLSARMQVLVEDEDRKAIYYVADIASDLAEININQA